MDEYSKYSENSMNENSTAADNREAGSAEQADSQNRQQNENGRPGYNMYRQNVYGGYGQQQYNSQGQYGQQSSYGQPGQFNQQAPYGQPGQFNRQQQYGQNEQFYGQYGQQQGWNGQQNQPYVNYSRADYQIPYTVQPIKKQKKDHKTLKKVAKLVASAAVFGIIAGGVFIGANSLYYLVNPSAAGQGSSQQASLPQNDKLNLDPVADDDKKLSHTTVSTNVRPSSTDVSEIVAATEPSVVAIDSTFQTQSYFGSYEQTGGGSGIIIDKTDNELLIATNNHVVENAVSVSVTFEDGSKASAVTKGTDPVADLAVLSVKLDDLSEETLNSIKVATLGSSDDVKVGQMAIAIGNALGYGQSTTVGYISAVDREVNVDGNTMILLQTDAAINPGNSGGALINIKGEVIGINSVKYADNSVEGMGFAIPISRAVSILNELKNREILDDDEKGYLGVYPEDVTSAMAEAYNWPVGVYVNRLSEDGPAQNAGIQVGDIITSINGVDITTSNQMREYVNSYRAGTVVKVTVQRLINGRFNEMEFEVELMQNPDLNSSDSKKNDKNPQPGDSDADSQDNGAEPRQGQLPEDGVQENEELPDEIKDFLRRWGFQIP